MKNYWQLIKAYPKYLLFGFLHFFFSSIGQTFLIGIYVVSISEQYKISTLAFSSIYALATLIGSFLLPYGGRLIDKYKIRTLSWINGISLSFFGIMLTLGENEIWLLISLVGMRFSGQGFMILLGSTAISRFFVKQRGKALSLSGLGLTVGEGLLPLFVLQMMSFQSWQFSLWLLCGTVLVVHIPLVKTLIKKKDAFQKAESSKAHTAKENDSIKFTQSGEVGKRYAFLTQPGFYVANLLMLFIPFAITGMFINHNQLVLHKGWDMELIAIGFTLYALVKVLVSIFFGEVIDRMSAVQLLPYFLLPFGIAFLALALGEAKWVALFYLGMTAISASLFSLLKSAIWAELYPPEILGTVKGITHFLIIVSSAAAPVAFNQLMLNKEIATQAYLTFTIVILILSVAAFWLTARIKKGKY
jgi:MFS family permease